MGGEAVLEVGQGVFRLAPQSRGTEPWWEPGRRGRNRGCRTPDRCLGGHQSPIAAPPGSLRHTRVSHLWLAWLLMDNTMKEAMSTLKKIKVSKSGQMPAKLETQTL